MVIPQSLFLFKNLKELAGHLKISERQARRLKAEGMPQRPDGWYDGLACQAWRQEKRLQKKKPSELPPPIDNSQEETKRQVTDMMFELVDMFYVLGLKMSNPHIDTKEGIGKFVRENQEKLGLLVLSKELEKVAVRFDEELEQGQIQWVQFSGGGQ